MTEIHGHCDERFAPLADVFRSFFDDGLDHGAALAVTLGDDLVVDLWGGTTDHELDQPWERDTVVRVFSTTKVMVMITVLVLMDRGLLDIDEPIARYWPEFARHGKHDVTTKQVLIHQSGLPGFGRDLDFADIEDWDDVVALLEDAELWFEPGSMSCYHPFTWGFLIGEVARRVTGVPIEDYFQRELAEPLDADFHFGLPVEEASRVASLWPPSGAMEMIESPMARRAMDELSMTADWFRPEKLGVVIPATSGIGNARAAARIGRVIATNGTVEGRQYLSPTTVAEGIREHVDTVDEMLGAIRWGLGFGLDRPEYPSVTPTTVHWGGFGGSFLTMDPATGIACAYTPNVMSDQSRGEDPRRVGIWRTLGAISDSLF